MAKKFLFVSLGGLIGDTAWQVLKEGHEVRYFIGAESERDIADGLVPKIDDWRSAVPWADVVVFDDTGEHGKLAADLRQQGKLVVGGSEYTARLEDDRSFGQEELRKAGVNIIPYREFTSFDEAAAYVRENPSRYVIKPSGEAQNVKRRLFVGEEDDGADVVRVLEAYGRVLGGEIPVFQLQKRVSGVEVAVGAFFNGHRFAEPININFEHKKLFPGNLGPSTGEMGTSMFWSAPNKLFNQTLKKMERVLARERYAGYVDLNCIVNANGIYPLEFTSRFGYPTIFIQQEGMITPIGEVLHGLAAGTLDRFKTRSGFQVGVRIIVPPYPFDDQKTFDEISREAVIVFKKGATEGLHIEDAKLRNGEWLVAGTSGVVLTMVGLGGTMKQAKAAAYARVKSVLIPNMYYRDDIGDRWADDSDRLHAWGYLRES